MIVIFLKAPRPGEVKTRLARSIGAEEACSVYRALAARQIAALPEEYEVRIQFTPVDALDEMGRWLGEDLRFAPQVGAGLGERLENAAADILGGDAAGCIFIGADCPSLEADDIRNATSELADGADLVFGPATDGGYYLLGMKLLHREIFHDIDWGTPSVLEESLRRAEQRGLSYSLLAQKEDVDEFRDLKRAVDLNQIDYCLQESMDF